jgi:hypothetical protein
MRNKFREILCYCDRQAMERMSSDLRGPENQPVIEWSDEGQLYHIHIPGIASIAIYHCPYCGRPFGESGIKTGSVSCQLASE